MQRVEVVLVGMGRKVNLFVRLGLSAYKCASVDLAFSRTFSRGGTARNNTALEAVTHRHNYSNK
jgi:hypothetical protein